MMPLPPGHENFKANVHELNFGTVGSSRKKAINTYSKKHNLSKADARFALSLKIASAVAKKK